jgi:hypothetical protein
MALVIDIHEASTNPGTRPLDPYTLKKEHYYNPLWMVIGENSE